MRARKLHDPITGSFDDVLSAIDGQNRPSNIDLPAKPFIKWVGGKRSILPDLMERLPKISIRKYHEPFVGGGALFFASKQKKAYLSDINFHLIETYQAIRDDVGEVIKNLKKHEKNHCKEYYLKMRERLSTEKNSSKIASIFIYINKTCFNGLYRVNKSGGFNVPMGSYKNPTILDEDNLINCSQALLDVEIYQHNFMQLNPKLGDFYYLDPPYHKTYDQYSRAGFGDDEHKKLAKFCENIDKSNGYFMLSNSDTPFIRKLYKNFTIETVSASRSVSCKANQRGKENELIIRNYKWW
jgi:DNA adenine methylase